MYTFIHNSGEIEELFKPWTVRTYDILRRNGIQIKNEADCIAIGDKCMQGKLRHGGRRIALELYRAGGLGIYNIYDRMEGVLSIEKIRFLCENWIDNSLHVSWD